MRALQVIRPGFFEQVEIDTPHLEGRAHLGQMVIGTRWVSLCGSDIPFFAGRKRHETYPLRPARPAHECIGQVVESSSDLYQPGDWVLAIPGIDEGLAECFLTEPSKTVRLSPALMEGGSCLIQPLSTVMNAVDRLGDVAGRSVAVVGLGSIGLLFCWLLKQRGARRIVGLDPVSHRCRWAETLGIDQALPLNSLELVHAVRQRLSGWEPPDICIEAVGHQMDTLNDCLELVGQRGTVLAFGVPDQAVYAIQFETFFRKNASLVAVVTPDWSVYLTKARDLYQAHSLDFKSWVTHQFPIGQAGQAFGLYASHGDGIIKTVLDATLWG